MGTNTDEFIGPVVLADADTEQWLYTVPAGGRARVHELVLANRGLVEVDVALYFDGQPLDGFFAGGLMPAGETWRWPLTIWKQGRVVYGVASVGGVVVVKAAGSLLPL